MYQADNQNDNVIEYAGRENNLSKEKEYLIFVNPDTGKEKKVKVGIGYDFLFLGILAFLFRLLCWRRLIFCCWLYLILKCQKHQAVSLSE